MRLIAKVTQKILYADFHHNSWNKNSPRTMSRKKAQPTSIGDKISELLAPQQLLDPEYNSDDDTVAKARYYDSEEEDHQPTAELSDIRKKNVRMLQDVDAKYSGKISSRNELDMSSEYEESSDSEAEAVDFPMKIKALDSDDDGEKVQSNSEKGDSVGSNSAADEEDEAFADIDDEQESNGEGSSNNSNAEDDDDDDSDGSSFDENESDFDGGDILPETQTNNDNESDEEVEEVEKTDEKRLQINKDVEKGVSIQNQLQIWEKLLEMRIHSQKILLKANSLPQLDYFEQLTSHPEFNGAVQKASSNVENLLTKLCTLQKALINQYPEMKEVSAKRQRTDVSDEPDRVSKIAKKLEHDFADFKDYRNATLSKWYDRTKVLTPGASKNLKQPSFDIIRNIEGALSNKSELIKKTQLYKGGYEIIGMDTAIKEKMNAEKADGESEPVVCSEIYDDTDFYHSQLRELIEFKTNTSTNPADMTKQFVELQKLRNKIKKVVDTRASKGRKIRYAVHNKMVNFMARNDPSEWSNEAKTELFSSLFGGRSG